MAFAAPVSVRDNVFRRRPGGAQIFSARPVHQRLGAGIARGWWSWCYGDAEGILQNFGHRRQAVGGAGGHGDDGVIRGQGVIVDVVDDGFHLAGGRKSALCARRPRRWACDSRPRCRTRYTPQSPRRLPPAMEDAAPLFGIHRNGFAVDDQCIFGKVDAPREGAVV